VERRRGEVDDQLSAREREVRRGRAGLPDVLADRDPDRRVTRLQQDQVTSLAEVAVLVEDPVIRKEVLAVDRLHAPVGAHRARVREVAVEPRGADERGDVRALARDLVERRARGADEPGPQEQILGRIAGRRELGEEHEVGPRLARVRQVREDLRPVAVEVADDAIDLRERESQGFRLTVTN
jgi:hypothetical protein